MDIQHKAGDSKGAFFIEGNGELKAEISYSKAGNTKLTRIIHGKTHIRGAKVLFLR